MEANIFKTACLQVIQSATIEDLKEFRAAVDKALDEKLCDCEEGGCVVEAAPVAEAPKAKGRRKAAEAAASAAPKAATVTKAATKPVGADISKAYLNKVVKFRIGQGEASGKVVAVEPSSGKLSIKTEDGVVYSRFPDKVTF